MKIQRYDAYEIHEYGTDYVPAEDGDVCKSKDVEQLEASHAAVCAMLEKVVNSAKHTISPVYSAVTEEWRNDYEYRLPSEVIREARMFVDRINTQNQITNTNGDQP